MFSKTKIALSAAIVLSTAVSASAATTHHPAHVHRSAIYNMVPGYNSQTYSPTQTIRDPRAVGASVIIKCSSSTESTEISAGFSRPLFRVGNSHSESV
jgi:hypothetical protein